MRKFLSLRNFLFVLSCILFSALLLFFHTRGIIFYDEGYIVNAALRVAHGEIPYRDFDMVYTPFSFVFTGVFLKLFGESLLVTRIAALIISLFSLFAIYKIVSVFSKNIFLHLVALLCFIGWGPGHTTFVWPVMFAICFFLYAILFYLYGVSKKTKKYFFLAGVTIVLLFLSKQNFGVAVGLVMLVPLLLGVKKDKKPLLNFLSGVVITSGIFFVSLFITGSLLQFWQNMYTYTFERILVQKALDTPFLYHGGFFERTAKFIFYTLPFSVAGIAAFILRKDKKRLWIIPILCAVFYLIGIRPTTDYNHLAPLLSLTFLPLIIIISSVKKTTRFLFTAFFIGLTIAGLYTAVYKGFYKWEYSLAENTTLLQDARGKVFTSAPNAKDLTKLTNFIRSHTAADEPIFVNTYAPLIYFLAERKNATRYDFVSSTELPAAYQYDAIHELQEKKVKIIVLSSFNKNEQGIITDFIKKNYKHLATISDWIIYSK